jgi:predicted dehydrogenase
MTRRQFVQSSVAVSTASTARSATRVIGANDRLRVGMIGCGGNANSHMRALLELREQDNVEMVAVCDIYQKRLDAAAALTGGRPYHDYRKVLEQPNVDYVVISVPDHWHAPITLDAADAGKHIYCEKPLTRTIAEGKKVVKKIKETGVKMQVGVQGMSDDSYETAQRYIQDGALGKVILSQIDYSRNHLDDFWTRPFDDDVRPGENLDWKTFLGSAKKRPFDPDRFFAWRRYWDYSGGIATDLFVHRLTRIVKACNLKTPLRVVATGGKHFFNKSSAEIPDTFNVMLEYPGGMTVLLVSSQANGARVRHMIRGHKATLEFNREGFIIEPEREYMSETSGVVYHKQGGEDMRLHHNNLHEAIRKNVALKCDVELGFNSTMACLMAVESYRRREYLAWDQRKQKIVKA